MRRKREKEKRGRNQPCRSHVSVHCDEQLELEHKTLSLHLVFTLHSEQKEKERERDTIERMPMTSAPMGATIEIHRDHTHTVLTYKDTTVRVCVCVCVCVFPIHVIWDSTASWQSHAHCAIQRWNSQTSVLYYNLEKCSEIHVFIFVWILLTVCWSDNFMPLLNI